MRRLRHRYGHGAKKTKHQLLRDAMRDWRSGRAFFRKGRYWLRPLEKIDGHWRVSYSRARVAPWSKEAIAEWKGSTEGLHIEARAAYPDEHRSSFEQLHGMDPVRNRLLQQIGDEGA